jgi:transcriptional regulator with XRE-family HTH domain
MLITLRIAMLRKGIRQNRLALELGWDPAKLSRIINGLAVPTASERAAIAAYLHEEEGKLFEAVNPSGYAA